MLDQQIPLLAGAAQLSPPGSSPPDGTALSTADTALLLARGALPAFLLAVLTIVLLFDFLSGLGERVTGLRPLSLDERAQELAKALETASKSGSGGSGRRAKSTKKDLLKELEERRKETRPRAVLLLVAFNLLAATYLAEGAALLLDSLVFRHGAPIDDFDLYPALGCLVGYLIAGLTVVAAKNRTDVHATNAMYLRVIALITVVGQPIVLVTYTVVFAKANTFDFLRIFSLIMDVIRVILAGLLAAAFHAKLRERVHTDETEEAGDKPEEEQPLLGPAAATPVTGTSDMAPVPAADAAANGTEDSANLAKTADVIGSGNGVVGTDAVKKEESKEEEDDDDEEEDDEKPKIRAYDIFAMAKRIKKLLPYLAPVRSRLVQALVVVCILLTLTSSACTVLVPRQMGHIVSDLTEGRSPYKSIIIWVLLNATIGYSGLLGVLRRSLWTPVDMLAERELSVMSFQHVLDLSARYHNQKKSGEVLNVLSRASSASDFLQNSLFEIAPVFLNVGIGAVYIASVYGLTVGAVLLGTGACYMAASLITRPTQIAYRTKANDRNDNVAAIKNESIASIDLVKYSGSERYEIGRYSSQFTYNQRADLEYRTFYRMVTLTQELILDTGILLGALLVARQIVLGQISIGSFVTFTSYSQSVLNMITRLDWMTQWSNQMMTSTDKLVDILEVKNEIVDKPDATEMFECRGDIEFDNVTFAYDLLNKKSKKKPRQALTNVSFKIKAGQHVALVGETGSGKSTIFKLLFRFFDVNEGSIKVDGIDVRDYTQRSLRQALGVVQQEGSLFNDTLLNNIRYGDIGATDEAVVEAAKVAKIHDRIREWPKKYHTVVGERGVKLSGGEKQRVSIARTVLKNPKVMLLDEATSALDSNTERDIQKQLRKLTEGKTVIAIAHRLSTIAYADKIIVLGGGKILETGKHHELLAIEGGAYAKLWKAQVEANPTETVKEEDSSMANESGIKLGEQGPVESAAGTAAATPTVTPTAKEEDDE